MALAKFYFLMINNTMLALRCSKDRGNQSQRTIQNSLDFLFSQTKIFNNR